LSKLFGRNSRLANPYVPLLPDLNRKFELLSTDQLRPLHRKNPRFDAVTPKRFFEFLDDRFFDLRFWVNNGADQAFAEGADALTHHLAGIAEFNDHHLADPIESATLSAVRLKDLLKFMKLCGGQEPG